MVFAALARKLIGSANDRSLKPITPLVDQVNAAESATRALSDTDLAARTPRFRERLAAGETLDDLLVEVFATVREAARRVLGERHFDVQLMGGVVLHRGMIAEMKTGEGKTLVATLPVYLNALAGKGVHVVTVNDYLARRDAEWMGRVYRFLGMEVGAVLPGMEEAERRAAYAADITYTTNNELGFDYLRDNLKFRIEDIVQRSFHFAIVDEVDSILIDEARTPLIISGQAEGSSELYVNVNKLIPGLADEDFEHDEKHKSVSLSESGTHKVESLLQDAGLLAEGSLYDLVNVSVNHHVTQALRAHKLFVRDRDYLVQDGRVVIVDEFTGRMMEGRRFSEGLHQALEAKEGAPIQMENQTLASVTFQNLFRQYDKLAGMTGTAMTEADEFDDIYKLEVVSIPTNVTVMRQDHDDEVYRTVAEKHAAVVELVRDCHQRMQPILLGTVSIEKSEALSAALKKAKVTHQVLNARYHAQEAGIIADAGMPGAVTIATNMAGRGTDIQLGGNPERRIAEALAKAKDDSKHEKIEARVTQQIADDRATALAAGGLFVVGTERHESRRIDNQLRGRSGRQGDPGASRFLLSLEDDLLRIFGSERMDGMLRRLGIEEGEAIVHPWINKALEKAQQKVEARNFEIRKNLLKYDDVMNDQRKVVYEQRREFMGGDDVSDIVHEMRHEVIADMVSRAMPEKSYAEQWDMSGLHDEVRRVLALDLPIVDWAEEGGVAEDAVVERLIEASDALMVEKEQDFGGDALRMAEKSILLQLLDQAWKDHLLTLDHLRQGIVLRAYGQKDPLNEYKREAFGLFESMLTQMRESVTAVLSHIRIQTPEVRALPQPTMNRLQETRRDPALAGAAAAAMAGGPAALPSSAERDLNRLAETGAASGPVRNRSAAGEVDPDDPATWGRVQRNAPCPCGSGNKYKHCHGRS